MSIKKSFAKLTAKLLIDFLFNLYADISANDAATFTANTVFLIDWLGEEIAGCICCFRHYEHLFRTDTRAKAAAFAPLFSHTHLEFLVYHLILLILNEQSLSLSQRGLQSLLFIIPQNF
jgi:hypothetical protein